MTFHGVRGSTPCHGPELVKYGGNTSCVSLSIEGHDPILFDMGTGLRYFGNLQPVGRPFNGACLLSHLHWDHIQGLPFFTPLLRDGSEVTLYGPVQEGDLNLAEVFADTIRPPVFPVPLELLPGHVAFEEVWQTEFRLGEIEVMARPIPHVGNTVGYRVSWGGASVAYLSDHQMPSDGSFSATAGALDLVRDVDLLIHDAQYTPSEFAEKTNWGHCTIEYAIWLAAHAGARRLALFHHDPSHDDEILDRLADEAIACGADMGVEVFAACEGQMVRLV